MSTGLCGHQQRQKSTLQALARLHDSARRGHSFFTTNEELLDRYAECPGSTEVIAVQTSYLESLHAAPRAVPRAGELHQDDISVRAPTRASMQHWSIGDRNCGNSGEYGASGCLSESEASVLRWLWRYPNLSMEGLTHAETVEAVQGHQMTTWLTWICRPLSQNLMLNQQLGRAIRKPSQTAMAGICSTALTGKKFLALVPVVATLQWNS